MRILQAFALLVALCVLPSCKQADGQTNGAQTPDSVSTSPGETTDTVSSPAATFEPIQVSALPLDRFGYPGQTRTFSVTATSKVALKYQWYHNNVAISGATTSTLKVLIAGDEDAGDYKVKVQNTSASQSATAILTVGKIPVITSQPESVAVYPGENASFSFSASGSSLEYKWHRRVDGIWKDASKDFQTDLLITSVGAADVTEYRGKAYNNGGIALTNVVYLTLKKPVTVSKQPVDVQAGTGQTVTFSAQASGNGVLYYRWYKGKYAIYDGSKYAGTSLPTLTIKNVTATDASLYKVKVFNDDNKFAYSTSAQLSVMGPAKVTVQPESSIFYTGQTNATLFIATSGDQPITYQWQKWSGSSWNNIAGGTKSTLPFSSISSSNAGRYRCVVTNAVAKDTSAEAAVTVLEGVAITSSPANKTATEGDAVKFTVAAKGDNLSYEWTKNGKVLSTNSASLSFASVKAVDEASYGCRVFNASNSATCTPFSLTVNAAVKITQQPVSQTTYEGGSVTLSVAATGDPAPTAAWYFGGKQVGSGFSLVLNNITLSQAGEYTCVVKNSVGSVDCTPVNVNISGAVKITSQPKSTTVNEGSILTLALAADGDSLSYEWKKSGTVIGSGAKLTFSSIKAANAGTYTCRVWNSNSSATCSSFTITVNQGVVISSQPKNASAFEDGSVTLSVTATGSPAPAIDWYFNNTMIKKDGASSLKLSPLTMDQAGSYYCRLTNSVGSVKCDVVTVTVREKVRITKQLANQVLNAGDKIVLNMAATGELPINYSCYHDGSLAVASTKTADLVIPASTSADNGQYYCTASNAGSSAKTGTVSMTVLSSAVGKVTFSWNIPTKRQNGDALKVSEIAGYEIYMANSAAGPFKSVLTAAPGETSAEVTDLTPGDYYFVMTTQDTNGLESGYSTVSKVTIK